MDIRIIVALISAIAAISAALIKVVDVEVSVAFFLGVITMLGVLGFSKPNEFFNWHSRKKFERYILVHRHCNNDWNAVFSLAAKAGCPCGTNIADAIKAKKVTIIGSYGAINQPEEDYLKEEGDCKIERLDGKEFEHTVALIKTRVEQGGEFQEGREKRGY